MDDLTKGLLFLTIQLSESCALRYCPHLDCG